MSYVTSYDKRKLIVIFITLLVLCEVVGYVTTMSPPEEQFFQLYLLGANHTASDYYPQSGSKISRGQLVTWYLGVVDNMGDVQLVSVRVKLSNRTIATPGDEPNSESPAPVVTEFTRFLQNNETWELPFIWSISNVTLTNGLARILTVQINNETYQIPDWSASNGGYHFRLIFELWTWQTDSNGYEFGWTAGGEQHVAWLQVWFDMTGAPPPPA